MPAPKMNAASIESADSTTASFHKDHNRAESPRDFIRDINMVTGPFAKTNMEADPNGDEKRRSHYWPISTVENLSVSLHRLIDDTDERPDLHQAILSAWNDQLIRAESRSFPAGTAQNEIDKHNEFVPRLRENVEAFRTFVSVMDEPRDENGKARASSLRFILRQMMNIADNAIKVRSTG